MNTQNVTTFQLNANVNADHEIVKNKLLQLNMYML